MESVFPAGRDRGIHDIYISRNLKPFHGNRIAVSGYPYLLPAPPRAVFPARLSSQRLRFPPCRAEGGGGTIASMIRQSIVLPIVPPIVSSLSCCSACRISRRLRPAISSVHLSARPLVPRLIASSSRCSRFAPSRSSPRRIDKQGGAGCRVVRIFSPYPSFLLVRCRRML